jgi:hypothetical protein
MLVEMVSKFSTIKLQSHGPENMLSKSILTMQFTEGMTETLYSQCPETKLNLRS